MKHLKMEDSFNTWFNITKLHVWMVASRCMAEEMPNSQMVRNELITRMWEDVTERFKKLGVSLNLLTPFTQHENMSFLYTFP